MAHVPEQPPVRYAVFIISGNATRERRPQMDEQLVAADLRGEYVTFSEKDQTAALGPLTPSETECFKSHMEAYRRVMLSGVEYGLVLEDDAIFGANLKHDLAAQLPPSDFDFYFISDDHFPQPLQVISERIAKAVASKTACAYVVSRRAAGVMLHFAESADRPIDHKMNEVIGRCNLQTYWNVGLVVHGSRHRIFRSAIDHTQY